MANSLKVAQAVTKKAIASFHNNLTFLKNVDRQYDSEFGKRGSQTGNKLQIRVPNQFTVRSGMTMNAQDVTEDVIELVASNTRGVDLNFTSLELALEMNSLEDQVLNEAMARLAAEVEKDVLENLVKEVFNMVGTPGTTPATLLVALEALQKLNENLVPDATYNLLIDAKAQTKMVDALKGLFHSSEQVSKQYEKGIMGIAAGFKWGRSQLLPTITNGTRDDSTPVVNTSTGITSGTATIAITGEDANVTIKKGEIFTVAGVFAVNPQTKNAYTHLQQFVATADATADGSGAVTVSVSPTPITSGAKQNVSIPSAGAGKAVVHVAAGGSGAASTGYLQNLAWYRGAFTFVTADLPLPKGVNYAARENHDGISLALVGDFDIVNRKFPYRFDIQYGYKALRPEWACRITG